MAIAYHTHTFTIPTASDAEAEAGVIDTKPVVPANLPPLFATKQDVSDALTSISGLTTSADQTVYTTAENAYATTALTSIGRDIIGGANAAAIRALIDAQQQFDSLDAIGALSPLADRLAYFTDTNAAALTTFTSFARTLLDDADAATAQQTLELEPGVDVQEWSQILDDIAGGDASPVSRPVLITTDYTRETYDSEIILASTATATRTLTIPEGLPVSTAITLRNDTDPDDEYNLIVQVGDGVDEPIFGTDDGVGIVTPQTAVTIVKVSTTSWRVAPPFVGIDPTISSYVRENILGATDADEIKTELGLDGNMFASDYDPDSLEVNVYDQGNHIGFTTSDITTKTIPAPVLSFRTSGFANAGDGGAAEFVSISTPGAPEAWQFETANGRWFEVSGDDLDVAVFGAVGGGSSEVTEWQTAIDYMAARGGGKLKTRANRTHILNDKIEAAANVEIDFAYADMDCRTIPQATALAQRYAVGITGTATASTAITANVAVNDTTITVTDSSIFTAGDLVFVQSEEKWPPQTTTVNAKKGALHLVRSVPNGTSIVLTAGSIFSHTTGNTPIVLRVDSVNNAVLRNGRFRMGGVNDAHNGIIARYAKDHQIIDCSVVDAEDTGFSDYYSWYGKVIGGSYTFATSPDAGTSGLGTTGYGVLAASGSMGLLVQNTFLADNRHSISGGGIHPAIFTTIRGNHIVGGRITPQSNYEIDNHEDCLFWHIDGNVIHGSTLAANAGGSGGILVRGRKTLVTGNRIVGAYQFGIYVHVFDEDAEGMEECVVDGNYIDGTRLAGIYADGDTTARLKRIRIINNIIRNPASDGILVATTDNFDVSNNMIIDSIGTNSGGVRLVGTVSDYCTDGKVNNNTIHNTTRYGIQADFARGVQFLGNKITGTGSVPILLTSCQDCSESDSDIRTAATTVSGIQIASGTRITCKPNSIVGGSGTGTAAVLISGTSTDISVLSGLFTGFQYSVRATNTPDYIIVGDINGRACSLGVDVALATNNKVSTNAF